MEKVKCSFTYAKLNNWRSLYLEIPFYTEEGSFSLRITNGGIELKSTDLAELSQYEFKKSMRRKSILLLRA